MTPDHLHRRRGRVVGVDGRGVAGARVWTDSRPEPATTSAPDGSFELEGLPGRTYEVRAQAGELVGGPQPTRFVDGGAPIVITLREGAHVLVSVVDAARAPVANAMVRVIGNDPATTTDAHGQARFTVHPGWITIEATGQGYAPRRVSDVTAPSGATSRITIVLHAGFAVSARVLDEDRRPIPNVRIYARQGSGMPSVSDGEHATAVTDEAGAFTIPSAVGMHTLVAIEGKHAPAVTPTFDVDRAITDLEIVMKAGGIYAGDVVDADGKPVAQARVYVETVGALGTFAATSDASGAFELGGLPRTTGGAYAVSVAYAVSDDGVSDGAIVNLAEQPELRGQRLVLRRSEAPAGAIAGVVVDDTGAPVAGALVTAAARRRSPVSDTSPLGVDSATASSATTNVRGELSIADLPAGEYGVWPGAGRDASRSMTSAKTGDVALRLVMPRPGAITGKVVFADTGEGVDDFTVDVQPRGGDEGATPGEQGAFEVRDLSPGVYTVRISGRGFLDANQGDVRVDAGKPTDVGTIAVSRGRTLTGRVVDPAGRGVAGARVLVGAPGVFIGVGRFDEPVFDQPGAVTDANGGFAIAGGIHTRSRAVSPLVVGADHPSYGRSAPVAIPPGTQDPPPITLTLLECGSIAGTVTRKGRPVAGATIGAGWPELGAALTNEDGAFAISRLPAGPVTLHVHADTEVTRSHQTTVQVEAGKPTDVTIDLPVGTITLAVVVKPRAGADVAGALLYLFGGTVAFENYAQLSARLFPELPGMAPWERDASRPATFDRLVPGDYTLCAIPLAGSPNDLQLMKRVREGDRAAVPVHCAPVRVAAAPVTQTVTVDVPAMAPRP